MVGHDSIDSNTPPLVLHRGFTPTANIQYVSDNKALGMGKFWRAAFTLFVS